MLSPFAEFKLTACPSNLRVNGFAVNARHHHATVCAGSLVVYGLRGICWATTNGQKQRLSRPAYKSVA